MIQATGKKNLFWSITLTFYITTWGGFALTNLMIWHTLQVYFCLLQKLDSSFLTQSFIFLAFPEKLVELIRRDYKGAVLCPFPWCENELQLELTNIFTRLKMISKKKERARLTDVKVNMTDVFKPHEECDKPRVVLIEGQPGMGKTTYCQKLAYDWSVGGISPESSFPKVEMLLLLKCRDMKTANIKEAIDDQLLPQDADKKEKENFFQFIRCNQSGILLVLDGLDELRTDLFQGFLPLIKGKVFSNTYLMLTARNETGIEVRRYCDTLIDIVGYTDEDADSYITKYFRNHEDSSLANKVIEKLNGDSHLRELSANPLNTALLCLVCEDTRGTFPSNRTKLYHELVSCALRRDFAKKNKRVPLDPIETCTDQLNQLGKMALKALKENRMYFNEDEMNLHSTDFLQLCFLSRVASVSKIRPTPCYAFTHKTFQEYFAAFHLAHALFNGDKPGRDTLLAQLSPVDKYWQVWEFLFTMVVSRSHDDAIYLLSRLCACLYHRGPEKLTETNSDKNLIRICEDTSYDWVFKDVRNTSKEEKALINVLTKTLNLIAECEVGENELKDYQKKMVLTLARCFPVYKFEIGKNLRGSLVMNEYLKDNCALTHFRLDGDFDELGLATLRVVLQSDHKLVHLDLCGNVIYNFLGVIIGDRREVERACLEIGCMQVSGTIALAQYLHSNRTLTHLALHANWCFDAGAIALAEVLRVNRTLTHLNLGSAMILDLGATALAGALSLNCTLTHLSLPENWITDFGAEAIVTGLQFNCGLLHLDLNNNWISNRGVIALAKGLEQGPGLDSNVTLTYLDLHQPLYCGDERTWLFEDCNHDAPLELIGESGALALARALRTNCTLTYLDLQENEIGDSGAAAIGEALQSNRNLTHLYLNSNKIGDRGAVALAQALQSRRTFTQLNSMQQRSVYDSGAVELHYALVKALHGTYDTQLIRLDLSLNEISSSGATALADALQYNHTLERLDLSGNKIECSGTAALAKALRTNQTLTHLDLRINEISDLGAMEFAETLEYNNTLTFLNLSSNPIGEFGAASLRQVDQSICTLEYSDLARH